MDGMRGQLILRTYHRGEVVSLAVPLRIEDLNELPVMNGWLFEEMDRALYKRIGHIPRERTWEVSHYGG
jgi:hypothetical protein